MTGSFLFFVEWENWRGDKGHEYRLVEAADKSEASEILQKWLQKRGFSILHQECMNI